MTHWPQKHAAEPAGSTNRNFGSNLLARAKITRAMLLHFFISLNLTTSFLKKQYTCIWIGIAAISIGGSCTE